VQVGVALDLGGAAAGLVQVVALHGDLVAGAVQVDVPVVVVVAGGRVVGLAVDVVVGEGDAVAGFGAEDVVLAADAGGLSSPRLVFCTSICVCVCEREREREENVQSHGRPRRGRPG
jgi:hypothetical protein